MESFIGCLVSLDCGESLGIYQGQVDSIDPLVGSLTLVRAFRNGVPYKRTQVTIRSEDINQLEIIKTVKDLQIDPLPPIISCPSLSPLPPSFSSYQPTSNKGIRLDLNTIFTQCQSKSFPSNNNLPLNCDSNQNLISLLSKNPPQQKPLKSSLTPPLNYFPLDGYYRNHDKNASEIFNDFLEQLHSKAEDSHKMPIPKLFDFKLPHYHGNYKNKHFFDDNNRRLMAANKPFNPSIDSNKHPQNNFYKNCNGGNSPLHKSSIPSLPPHGNGRSNKRNNSECFVDCEGDFNQDFDFETNLALFDKTAVALEISKNNHNPHQPGPHNPSSYWPSPKNHKSNYNDLERHELKFKHDENVIKGLQMGVEQIHFNDPSLNEKHVHQFYKTDAGFLVPAVSEEMRKQLIEKVLESGFGVEKIVEAFGRSLAEAILLYLGGGVRFDPKNAHQPPSVLVVVDSDGWTSASSISCARLLANRATNVFLFIQNSSSPSSSFSSSSTYSNELKLFNLTSSGIILNNIREITKIESLDLIILESKTLVGGDISLPKNPKGLTNEDFKKSLFGLQREDLNKWFLQNKSPLFAVEPSQESWKALTFKRSFVSFLPPWLPSEKFGQVCFCDLGIPEKIFSECGLVYKSVFFDKFFLTLHQNDSESTTNPVDSSPTVSQVNGFEISNQNILLPRKQ